MLRKISYFFLILLFVFSSKTQAQPDQEKYKIIAPHCLIRSITAPYQIIHSLSDLTFIEVDSIGLNQLIKAKKNQKTMCGGFMNVTEDWNQSKSKISAKTFLSSYAVKSFPVAQRSYDIHHEKEVNQLLKKLNPQHIWDNLTYFSQFQDRYADSSYGVNAAHWLKTYVEDLAKSNHRQDVTVYTIETSKNAKHYKQPSVIVKIGSSNAAGIVIGAHMDTLSSLYELKPGADDDGSGSMTVLEIATILLSNNMHFKKPIYLMWYAAEEEGLVGSGSVVSVFKKQSIPIEAVLHFDMTGFAYKNDPTMWLMTDYVNTTLVAFLEKLITTYVKQPVKYSHCGYACSDHAIWTKNGFAAAIAAEAAYEYTNKAMHSSNDTQDKLSLAHMTDYLKLGIAYTVELAEPLDQ